MEEAKLDEKHYDTSCSLEESGADNVTEGIRDKTMNNSSTFDFAEKSWKTDFTLIVEGTEFHVAKNILALASPVFDRMFESDFKESTTAELELPGKKADVVREFLIAVYPNTCSVLSKVNALKVLPLAEEYQVLNLKRRCEAALLESIDAHTATGELFQMIKEAHLYCLKDLSHMCVGFITEKAIEEIEKANREILLPSEALRDIVQNLISRMRQLETSALHQAEQLQTYKTWKNYLLKSMKRSKDPKLYESLGWVGQTRIYMIDIKNMKPNEDNVILWNTKFSIELRLVQYPGNYIRVEFKNRDKNKIECEFQFQIVVVNRIPLGEHHSVKQKNTFSSNNQSANFDLYLSDIEDPKKGFVYEGKVQVEVNIFMSEPKRLKNANL